VALYIPTFAYQEISEEFAALTFMICCRVNRDQLFGQFDHIYRHRTPKTLSRFDHHLELVGEYICTDIIRSDASRRGGVTGKSIWK